jgi:hypothetical protein
MGDDADDGWDVFGSESEGGDDDDDRDDTMNDNYTTNNGNGSETSAASIVNCCTSIATFLSQVLVKHNSQVRFTDRTVGVLLLIESTSENVDTFSSSHWMEHLKTALQNQRELQVVQVSLPLPSTSSSVFENDPSHRAQHQSPFYLDALVVISTPTSSNHVQSIAENAAHNQKLEENMSSRVAQIVHTRLLPGGMLVWNLNSQLFEASSSTRKDRRETASSSLRRLLTSDNATQVFPPTKAAATTKTTHTTQSIVILAHSKQLMDVHVTTCPWLPSSHCVAKELELLHQATISLSAIEAMSSHLTDTSIQRAVQALQRYGYCILPKILNIETCRRYGQAILQDVHLAAERLKQHPTAPVDIYNPHQSLFEPQAYQELSMREDLRLDLRQGPSLQKIRTGPTVGSGDRGGGATPHRGNESLVLQAKDYAWAPKSTKGGGSSTSNPHETSTMTPGTTPFLRGHPSLLEIVRRTMNPQKGKLYRGNLGRYNFEGSGPDGSFQTLRTSPVGGIVSLPGAADQAIHADTPHLFEHLVETLPAHYINIFTPGVPFHPQVGGTAFFSNTHQLDLTAKYNAMDDNGSTSSSYAPLYPYLVRPCLDLGDAVLFDCRILHFGLANTSSSGSQGSGIERPMLYTNTTHAWFTDPKSWDKDRRIFPVNLDHTT